MLGLVISLFSFIFTLIVMMVKLLFSVGRMVFVALIGAISENRSGSRRR